MSAPRSALIALALVATLTAPSTSWAADTVTHPYPGMKYTHRSQSSPRKEIHIVEVDLSRPEISLRSTKSGERGKTPSQFSSLVGAAAVINGDFFNTDGSFDPSGLAIGQGVQWSDGTDNTSSRFIACTAAKACTIETGGGTTAVNANWRTAVGGRRALVKPDGSVFTAAQDTDCGSHCTTLHPRAAVGMKATGNTLVLVLVEGRQDPVLGMKISQLANLMSSLGCNRAIELDGGGSSTLVVAGERVSGRPDSEPGERRVANHLAVIIDDAAATDGRLVGFVREGDIQNDDAPIAGATVRLSDGQTDTTNAEGLYEFATVARGAVTVTVSKAGFVTATASRDVDAGITNWKSVALSRTPPPPPPPPPPDEEPVGEGEGEVPAEGEGEDVEGEGEGEGEGEVPAEGEGEEVPTEGEGEEGPNDVDVEADVSPSVEGGCSAIGASSPLAWGLLLALLGRRRRR